MWDKLINEDKMGENAEESHISSHSNGNSNGGNEVDTITTSPASSPPGTDVQFYIHPQNTISETLIPILYKNLPYSNPIYSRMLAPHNIPSRHCLFAATFPPNDPVPALYTIVFSDRSRKNESQIWIFNPLITPSYPQPLSQEHSSSLTTHLQVLLTFLKNTIIPQAPGHPFDPILKFACLHETITDSLTTLLASQSASQPSSVPTSTPLIAHHTTWNLYLIPTTPSTHLLSYPPPHPFTISRVPPQHIPLVISTSAIPREASTLLAQPSLCLLTPSSPSSPSSSSSPPSQTSSTSSPPSPQQITTWSYIGIDGTLSTLYVLPTHRNLGLATYIARELVGRLGRGEFKDLGFNGESGWVHADVKEGNVGSEGVMRALGGKKAWVSSYLWVDCGGLHG
ncbi:hypothetical protein SBOR_6573 [Sclerotinia borealis F-4128]|uniref:FR47-like domain-containing protein n=1 Tax=Sclerotinia borealis (strain F-4128) TaxID=1432307 RepID=W9C8H3_SCLBF|nr:hypothetical protein SBOR_6573 [Sclerotinia borealis F-4128]